MDLRALTLALLALGCADARVGAERAPILNGDPSADEAVVALLAWDGPCDAAPRLICSGLLVAPRVVLTAGHCVDSLTRAPQANVFFGADITGPGTSIAIDRSRVDPTFDLATGANDLGLLLLAEDAPAAPLTLLDHDASALALGSDLRVVGLGVASLDGAGDGVRRTGTMATSAIDATDITSEPSPSMSCSGDSGGPVFATIDGVETLVGVTSGGDRECRFTARNARVDIRLDAFVRPAVAELEALAADRLPTPERLAGLCGERCTSDDECPVGMTCDLGTDGMSYCFFGALGPGAFQTECASDTECPGTPCLRVAARDTCHCFAACLEPLGMPDASMPDAGAEPLPTAGCACHATPSEPRGPSLLALALVLFATRRRRAALRTAS